MAFIDWLRKQHADSLRASQRMAADPFLKGMQPGANVAPAPAGAIPFQRTKPGFFARDYKKDDLVKKVMIEKNDGTKEIKSEWEEPRFPVHQSNIRVSALPPEPVMSPGRELRGYPTFDRDSFRTRGMGGFTGGAQRYDMGMDPGWSGVPQARAAPAPRRVQPRSAISPEAQAAIAQVQATGGQNVDASGNPIGVASIANIGMPRVADLRNRIAAIDRQQAAIPRQQMPPPRFVPPVDPSQFPIISPGQIAGATYDAGDPRVQMSGGFDWSGQALRENVGEDLRGIWSPIKERMDKILEDIRKRREGQTMAPFDWRNN
jgi:hypothetical protein